MCHCLGQDNVFSAVSYLYQCGLSLYLEDIIFDVCRRKEPQKRLQRVSSEQKSMLMNWNLNLAKHERSATYFLPLFRDTRQALLLFLFV